MLGLILKYVLPAVAVLGVLFGVYELGHSKGYDQGHQVAWDTQQKTINSMADKANAEAKSYNQKVEDIQQQSTSAAGEVFAAKAAAALTRSTVVTKYQTQYVQVANSCGWDSPTVDAINQIISADPQNDVVPDVPTSAPTAASSTGVSQ